MNVGILFVIIGSCLVAMSLIEWLFSRSSVENALEYSMVFLRAQSRGDGQSDLLCQRNPSPVSATHRQITDIFACHHLEKLPLVVSF